MFFCLRIFLLLKNMFGTSCCGCDWVLCYLPEKLGTCWAHKLGPYFCHWNPEKASVFPNTCCFWRYDWTTKKITEKAEPQKLFGKTIGENPMSTKKNVFVWHVSDLWKFPPPRKQLVGPWKKKMAASLSSPAFTRRRVALIGTTWPQSTMWGPQLVLIDGSEITSGGW